MKWADVIAKPGWADLDAEQQSYARQKWVDLYAVPEARKADFTEQEITSLREKAIMEFDNGQGMVSSFFASAGRGLASTASGIVGGVGALTNDPSLMAAADEMDRSVANALPVNPSLTKTNFVGNALGQAGGVMVTAGAGGAFAKGMAGVRAIAAGSEVAAMTSGVLSGARGGAQDAEQYGMTGGDYAARVVFGGVTEFVTEKLPFGMATETGFAQRLLGGAVKPSRALTFGGGVVTESLEEGLSQTVNNAANITLAPAGTETPTLFTGVAGSMAGGAIGGSFFGAVNAAAGGGPAAPPLPLPAGFTTPAAAAAPTVANPTTVAPTLAIPIGKASLNGQAFVFDGAGWQRPATEEEMGAEPSMLLRPLDPNDAAEGAVIAALNAKAQSALRRNAEEKAAEAPAAAPEAEPPPLPEPEAIISPAPLESPLPPSAPSVVEEGVPPLPGLPPPPGMRWDMEGNAVPLPTNEPNNQTPPAEGNQNQEAAPGVLPVRPMPAEQDPQTPEATVDPQPVEGRAQPLTAPVITPSGPRPIGTLAVGDTILAPDKTSQKITGVFPQGSKRVFLLKLADGSAAPASADHLWLAKCGTYAPEVVTTNRLRMGLEMGEDWALPVMAEN